MANTQLNLILFTALNILLFLNAQYVKTPRSTDELQAILKHSIELKCEYQGVDGDGKFLDWYKNGNESVSKEKAGHYIVKSTKTESILIIKIFVLADGLVNTWSVKTGKPGNEMPSGCQFGRIPLKSSPQSIEGDRVGEELDSSDRSIRRKKGSSVRFKCIIKPDRTDSKRDNTIQWQFSKDGKDDTTYSDLPAGVNIAYEDQISIERINKAHRGYYRCTLNNVSFTVLLRVKDQLAVLWPFLGIIGVVALLVMTILIFEKRQKSAKKATTEDDDHTHGNDPLVRSSDNETKKRVIKT